ncbi:MAG: hypothetical protein ACI90V_009706 [Bacillariaceae sp.]|jgi:hypothetical protein
MHWERSQCYGMEGDGTKSGEEQWDETAKDYKKYGHDST